MKDFKHTGKICLYASVAWWDACVVAVDALSVVIRSMGDFITEERSPRQMLTYGLLLWQKSVLPSVFCLTYTYTWTDPPGSAPGCQSHFGMWRMLTGSDSLGGTTDLASIYRSMKADASLLCAQRRQMQRSGMSGEKSQGSYWQWSFNQSVCTVHGHNDPHWR